jgi:hypothetical protein
MPYYDEDWVYDTSDFPELDEVIEDSKPEDYYDEIDSRLDD